MSAATNIESRGKQFAGIRPQLIPLVLLLTAPAIADPVRHDEIQAVGGIGQADLAPDILDISGAVIGAIIVDSKSIFDLDNPAEDKALYRLANRVHATTRPHVIEQQLLFAKGDVFSSRMLEESERILRSNRYIQEASIEPIRHDDGVVDVHVSTSDVWTLMPKLSFSRSGGNTSYGFGIEDTNLFGTGITVEALYESDVDRDSNVLKFVDQHLGESWYGIRARLENNSDGYTRFLEFGKPFYSLDSTNMQGVLFLNNDRVDSLYDQGEVTAQFRHQTRSYEVIRGWSKGLREGWARRYTAGLASDEHLFTSIESDTSRLPIVPADRQLLYPFVGIEFVQDKYDKTVNQDQIDRVEDRFLGTSISARLGVSRADLGSDRDAWLVNAGAKTSFEFSERSSLFLATDFASRWESDGANDLTLDLNARYYKRQSDKRLFFAGLSGTYGRNLDVDHQILLGGDNGLRGYPARYQTGDKRVLLTLEQRLFTDWYPFRLFRVGGAVFFDAGRVWGNGPLETRNDGLLRDVGIGLRIGNTRSGLGHMVHIDVAFPLDGNDSIDDVQLLIVMKDSF